MALIQSLFVIFAIIAIGIICEKKKIISHTQIEGFEIFLFKIAMPCYLFTSTLHHDLATLLHTKYIASYLLAFLSIAGLVSILFYRNNTKPVLCIKILASGYVNAAIYALPIITFLLKDPTAAIIGNLLQIIVIQPLFITILSLSANKEESIVKKLIAIVSTPLTVMPVIGLLCNYLQFTPPSVISQAVQALGNGASGIALFTFGLTLGGIKLSKKNIDKDLVLMVCLKNILHPIMAFLIGKYFFQLETYWLYSLVIATSAPTAFIIYLIAKQFSIEQELVKKVVAVSSIMSLISLVIISSILG